MYPILFTIGPVTIYTYGVALAIGVLVGLCLAIKEGKRELISPNKIIDLFLWIIISGFIGARVVYIFTEWNYFLKYPLNPANQLNGPELTMYIKYNKLITNKTNRRTRIRSKENRKM